MVKKETNDLDTVLNLTNQYLIQVSETESMTTEKDAFFSSALSADVCCAFCAELTQLSRKYGLIISDGGNVVALKKKALTQFDTYVIHLKTGELYSQWKKV